MFQKFLSARLSGWLLISGILILATAFFAKHLVPVFAFKLAMVGLAGWAAYWFDRAVFYYARPDQFCSIRQINTGIEVRVDPGLQTVFAAAQLRRAIIIAAAMVSVALGA